MNKHRKQKAEILIPLMETLIRAGKRGVIVNAGFARENKWTPTGLHLAVTNLCERKIIICSSGGHNKRVSIPEDITSHSKWLPLYFGGRENVPPRYRPYLEDIMPQKVEDEVMVPEPQEVKRFSVEKDLLEKNEELHATIQKLLEENARLKTILASIKVLLPQEN